MKCSMTSVATIATAMLLLAGNAAVADDSGWYAGGNLGQSRATIDEARIVDGLKTSGFTTASITDDDRHLGYKLFGGYQFDRYLSLEAGYFDLGQFNFAANTMPPGTYRGNLKLNGGNVDLVGTLPLTRRFALLARIGANYADVRDSFSGTGLVVVTDPRRSENATNYKFGFGMQYAFTESLVMRAEAERYRIDDPVERGADIDLISIGLLYRFGRHPAVTEARAEVVPTPVAEPVAVVAAPEPVPEPPAPPPVMPTQQYCSVLDVQFEINRHEIRRQDKEKLAVVGTFLTKYPQTTAVIEGHTDNVGTPGNNMTLSEARAESVVSYLEDHYQIAADRLTAVGYGDTRPRADNSSEEGKRLNRRIDAVIACVSDMAGLAVAPARFTLALRLDFDEDQSAVMPQYHDGLSNVANFLKANPSVTATVEGHSGNVHADPVRAMALSRERAQSVVRYLTDDLGVNPDQVTARGFGESRLRAYGNSAEGRQENRRVNIILNYPESR